VGTGFRIRSCAGKNSLLPTFPRLSLRLHGGLTPQQCVAQAQAAEAAGFAGVWFAENPFSRGILPATAACALATRRLHIGAGVFNPYNRHPTLIAMEIGALAELAPGRVRLGIGSGIGSAVERMGFAWDRPLTTLREAVTIVRALLRGEEVSHAGAVFQINKVRLMAGRGERSLRAAGEIADGLIVSNMTTLAFAARAVKVMHEAARAAGRTKLPNVVQYLPCFPHPDREEAQRRATRAVADMLPAYWRLGARLPAAKQALLAGSGIDEAEFAAVVARLDAGETAQTALDGRFVAAFTVTGNAEDCRRRAAAYGEAGITELALTFSGEHAAGDMRLLVEAIA
jgi:5,10-methylenetetrahydromethanopterin reductase